MLLSTSGSLQASFSQNETEAKSQSFYLINEIIDNSKGKEHN